MLISYLSKDSDAIAGERSIFYILNTIRRGGFAILYCNEILIFAKDYDKNHSLSLIYCSNRKIIDVDIIKYIRSKLCRNFDIFIHYLFENKANKILSVFKTAKLINCNSSLHIGSYPDENEFPQVIYPILNFPKFNNSIFLKSKYIDDKFIGNEGGDFKQSIFEYLNIIKKDADNICEFSSVLDFNKNKYFNKIITDIINNIMVNWVNYRKTTSDFSEEYYYEPIMNFIKLFLSKKNFYQSRNKVIFRSFYNTDIKKGGFWIGEYIYHKSLLLPHVVLTDYFYKGQYRYLLYDIIKYAYYQNIDYVNIGGSENKNQFNLKSSTKWVFDNNVLERKLYTVYIGSG